MELSDIKASKLFKVSSRKEDILKKYPVVTNIALEVQTMAQVHDDRAVVKEDEHGDTEVKDRDINIEENEELENKEESKSKPVVKKSATPSKSSFKPKEDKPESNKEDESNPSDTTNTDVENSEDLDNLKTVESASGTPLPATDVTDHMDLEVQGIKGILNADASTFGVQRVQEKDKEVWIYYNDDINLNDVMVEVIEMMNKAGYTYLEFNRLARTDNAIVFVIIKDDTNRTKKPESELLEDVNKE